VNTIDLEWQKLQSIESSYAFRRPLDLFKQYTQTIDDISHILKITYKHKISLLRENILNQEERLKSLDPYSVLKRGYSICYKIPEEVIIRSSRELKSDDDIRLKFYKGGAKGKIQKLIE